MGAAVDITQGRSLLAGRGGKKRQSWPKLDTTMVMRELADTEAEKQSHLGTWADCADLAMPTRNVFYDPARGQGNIPSKTYDSHPQRSLRRGVGNLLGALMPPEQEWAEVVTGPEVDKGRAEKLNKGLEVVTRMVFSNLQKCRVAGRLHSMAFEMMLSTGFLAVDPGTQEYPFVFTNGGLHECFPVEAADGTLKTNYRRYKCRVGYILQKWPMAKLTPNLATAIANNPLQSVEILEGTIYDPGWGFRLVVFDSSDREHPIVDVPGDDPEEPNRWIMPRLYVRPGECYGTGPLVESLPSMRYLNESRESRLRGRQKRDNPPLLMDSETGLNPHTIRLGSNYVGMINGMALAGRAPFYELPSGQRDPLEEHEIQSDRAIIDDILFATDVVPPVPESHQMTAFEVSVRRQQLLVQQGVDLGRVQGELPYALMERCIWILAKLNMIPEIKLDGRLYQLRYKGPLAQAQDAEKANQIFAFAATARSSVGDEAAALGLKIEDVVQAAGELWPGLPNSLLRDEQERIEMQKQAAQIMAQQAAGAAPTMQQSALPGPPEGAMA